MYVRGPMQVGVEDFHWKCLFHDSSRFRCCFHSLRGWCCQLLSLNIIINNRLCCVVVIDVPCITAGAAAKR